MFWTRHSTGDNLLSLCAERSTTRVPRYSAAGETIQWLCLMGVWDMCAQNGDSLGEATFLEAVDSEMQRRFRSGAGEAWLTEVLDAVNAEPSGDEIGRAHV